MKTTLGIPILCRSSTFYYFLILRNWIADTFGSLEVEVTL